MNCPFFFLFVGDGWYLEKVLVKEHKESSQESVFPSNCWLDATEDEDSKTSCELFVNNKPKNCKHPMSALCLYFVLLTSTLESLHTLDWLKLNHVGMCFFYLFFYFILLCKSPDTQGLKATSRCGLQSIIFPGAVATCS